MTDIVEQTKAILAIFIALIFLFALLPAFPEIGVDPMSTVMFSIAGILFAIAIFLALFKR